VRIIKTDPDCLSESVQSVQKAHNQAADYGLFGQTEAISPEYVSSGDIAFTLF